MSQSTFARPRWSTRRICHRRGVFYVTGRFIARVSLWGIGWVYLGTYDTELAAAIVSDFAFELKKKGRLANCKNPKHVRRVVRACMQQARRRA